MHFGSTTARPKRRSSPMPSWAPVAASGVAIGLVMLALAFCLWRCKSSPSYNRVPMNLEEVSKVSQDSSDRARTPKPEDLFFRAADLADRMLASKASASPGELGQELQQLREQVASCPSQGDADRRRLAL